jgi:hypothetical protein
MVVIGDSPCSRSLTCVEHRPSESYGARQVPAVRQSLPAPISVTPFYVTLISQKR